MAATTYREYLRALTPRPIAGDAGQDYVDVMADGLDDERERMIAAAKQGMPLECDSESLAHLGRERLLEATAADTVATHSQRLVAAWDIHTYDGSPFGILKALATLGYDGTNGRFVIVQQNGLYHELAADQSLVQGVLGPNPVVGGNQPLAAGVTEWWSFDALHIDANLDQFNSRWALIIPTPPASWITPTSPPTADPDTATVNAIIRMCNRVRDGGKLFMGIWVNVSGVMWGFAPSTWGGGLVWGGAVIQWSSTEY